MKKEIGLMVENQPMPHDQPWLDDCQARHQAELQAQYEHQARQFDALNAVMAARRKANCSSLVCIGCGNYDCVIAAKEYVRLWPDEKTEILNQNEHASAAVTPFVNTQKTALKPDAKCQNSHEPKLSDRPGDPASGINLFNLDKAA